MTRRLVALAGVVAVAGALVLLPIAGTDAADAPLSAYGGDASATSLRVLAASNALSNFRTGFLDNSYPLATSHLDAAPASQAIATVADTGPAGGLVVSQAPTVVQQPQYAIAAFPGVATASRNQGASVAEAAAGENSARAHAALAIAGSAGPVEQPGDIAHLAGVESTSRTALDRASATVDASSVGHVDRASFAGGTLVLTGLDVRASVSTTASKATPRYTIALASATVGGVPVAITERGVVVAEDVAAGADAVTRAVNVQLNEALARAGLQVFLTPPVATLGNGQATVEVSGVHVRFTAPAVDPSVPTLTAELILGQARAFGFAVAGTAPDGSVVTPSVSAESTDTSEPAPEVLADVQGPIASLAPEVTLGPPRTGGGGQAVRPVSVRRSRPTWLVPVYVVWQLLVLATAGVLVWSRPDRG